MFIALISALKTSNVEQNDVVEEIEDDKVLNKTSGPPRVGIAANMIDIEVRGNSDYFGPLYIGDDYRENHMIYDTMSEWTIVVGDNTKGSDFPGNYDEKQSTTAKPYYT